ncbi:class F sortase [Salipaludibacillus keqinensis]|uniref:class F sortase n=1 Tax=Salipaludibacillus keqinensis TaxID=2045207 RepID=UPI001304B7EA|nr:class F sortase [Salipaludibacillus keqinensis]
MSIQSGFIPTAIHIPSLDISTSVLPSGISNEGEFEVPSTGDTTVWFTNSFKPGANGNAVIAGHVDDFTGPAIFFTLKHASIGDLVIVEGEKNESFTFQVVSIESYPRRSAPIQQIFGYSSKPKLNLITCHGAYNRNKRTHEERLVIYTELVE